MFMIFMLNYFLFQYVDYFYYCTLLQFSLIFFLNLLYFLSCEATKLLTPQNETIFLGDINIRHKEWKCILFGGGPQIINLHDGKQDNLHEGKTEKW